MIFNVNDDIFSMSLFGIVFLLEFISALNRTIKKNFLNEIYIGNIIGNIIGNYN